MGTVLLSAHFADRRTVPMSGIFAALFCFFSKHLHIIYGLEKVSVLALM